MLTKLNTHKQKNEIGLYLTSYKKTINSKWIEDLNIRPGTINCSRKEHGKKLLDIGLGNDFLDMTPKAQAEKIKIDKWDCSFSKAVEIIKWKDSPYNARNYLQTIYLIRGWYLKYTRNSYNSIPKQKQKTKKKEKKNKKREERNLQNK